MHYSPNRSKMLKQQKQPSTAAAKKAAAALRAQLHQELENKKSCSYQPHQCTQLTLEGYDFCLRHILEDKNAPYRQCHYIYNSNGKRCHLAAPKGDKKDFSYCTEHALKSHLVRVRTESRHQPATSTDTLFNSLTHYVKPTVDKSTNYDSEEDKHEELKVTKSLNPFSAVDAFSVNASCSDILEYASESESDVEPAMYGSVWHDAQADSSDDESIDSEQEDILKHAGIYTSEEATLVLRDKLIRLQSLYIEQFKHLQYTLRERRRKYLQGLKREKETLSNIHNQPRESPKEQRIYNKLKALNHYYRKHGIDAIMNKKCTELRAKLTEGMSSKQSSYTKCIFTEGGVKCGERVLPVARYCRKHILNDPNQVLFKRCGRVQADIECNEPVVNIFKDATCKFHMEFPEIRNYGESKKDEDSDVENASDTLLPMTSAHFTTPTQSYMDFDIKTETGDSFALDIQSSSDGPTPTPFVNQFPDADPQDYMHDMGDIDVTTMDSDIPLSISPPEESDNSQNMNTESPNVNRTIDEEKHIDPDDDMAGILLELQKDKISVPKIE